MSVFMTKIPIKVFPSHITTDNNSSNSTNVVGSMWSYIGVLRQPWPIKFTTLTNKNKNKTERSRNLDSATTVARVINCHCHSMNAHKCYDTKDILYIFYIFYIFHIYFMFFTCNCYIPRRPRQYFCQCHARHLSP